MAIEKITQNNVAGDNIQGDNVVVNKLNQCIDTLNSDTYRIDLLKANLRLELKQISESIQNLSDTINYERGQDRIRIDELSMLVRSKKDKKSFFSSTPYLKILITIISGSVFFWLLAVFAYRCFDFALDQNNVIITLIGVLATFVVVSNYMQVKDIEAKFNEKILSVESLNEKKINSIKCHLNLEIISSHSGIYFNADIILEHIIYASRSIAKDVGVDDNTLVEYLDTLNNFHDKLKNNIQLKDYINIKMLNFFIDNFPRKLLNNNKSIVIDNLYKFLCEIREEKNNGGKK
jgi:hypothetical protein